MESQKRRALIKNSPLILPLCTFAILILFFEAKCNFFNSNKAKIEEKVELIKTYPFSDPDPVPIFVRSSIWGGGSRLYPYFSFDGYSNTGVEKPWTVVRMDNPYIRIAVLPQVGGKIWGASEKSTGLDFIYTNHVLKFRQIALRGPWTSGGIEFNFGIIGHTPAAAAPVDYFLRKEPDGSVSCIVGTMDLPSRSRWTVTIILPKDKALFETRAFWYNFSPFKQSYYAWMNAAVKASPDLKYIFPGRFHIGHDYSLPLEPWPLDGKGRDLSWYKNNAFGGSKSYFTVAEFEDFYGCYWTDPDFGFGHWALYDDLPGHKIWIWDLSRAGEIWVNLLTDSDGQYSEPQAGRLLNQSDHEFFFPYSADRWKEIWFPYRKIGPMVKASPYAVLNTVPGPHSLKISLCALQKIDDDLIVKGREMVVLRQHLRLKPMETYEKTLPLAGEKVPFEVNLGKKLYFSSDPKANDLEKPLEFRDHFPEDTAEGIFLAASCYEKERNYNLALQKYLDCLQKEPLHIRALCRVAELYCRRAEYEKGLSFARQALQISMYDPEANYVYSLISRHSGHTVEAKEALGWAARGLEYRSAAYRQLAEIYLYEKNYELALEYAQRAVDSLATNVNALEIMASAYRKARYAEKAKQVIGRILEIDPLNHLARFELYLLDPTFKNLKNFQSLIRNELPHENYLEMALRYVKVGLFDEAVEILNLAPEYPTVAYWLAYLLRNDKPKESEIFLEKATNLAPWFCFPFREESIPVFEWAAQKKPDDWKPYYYLGLILWSKGRLAETLALFEKCDSPDFFPFYLARGYLYQDSQPEKALDDYEQAVRVGEKSWRTWHTLANFYLRLQEKEKALEVSRKALGFFPEQVPLQIDLVKSLMSHGRYGEAAEILEKVEALPFEGASDIHNLFVDCQIQLAIDNIKKRDFARAIIHLEKSKEYPERLGTGKPFNPDYRLQDYLEIFCYEKLGQKEKAERVRKSVYDYTIQNWEERGPHAYFGGLVLEHFGEKEKAKELLRKSKAWPEILEIIEILKH